MFMPEMIAAWGILIFGSFVAMLCCISWWGKMISLLIMAAGVYCAVMSFKEMNVQAQRDCLRRHGEWLGGWSMTCRDAAVEEIPPFIPPRRETF